jgi:amidase
LELIEASAARTAECEPKINALPIQCFDRARDRAKLLENQPGREHPGWLAGLPISIKDLIDVEG